MAFSKGEQMMRTIEGPDFNWRGIISTTEVTHRALEAVAQSSVSAGYDTVVEKMIGTNNLRTIAVLEELSQLARSVAYINVPGVGVATGFMIAPDVLMTNHHVLPSADIAARATIRFNYQMDLSGSLLPTEDYGTDISKFYTYEPLDYSIVKVKGAPGFKWGFIKLPLDVTVKVRDDVFIVQHPAGGPKQIALSDNEIAYVDETLIQYLTDTLPGASGSPVLDDSIRLIGIHHSGGWIPEPSTGSTHYRNEGILMSAIRKNMPKWALIREDPA
jgi:V8-like Glu-specific endopeptidase